VLNAHNTLFGSKPYCLATIHEGYRQDRQWFDSVGRVVLQTVAWKSADRQTWHDLCERESSGFSDESATPRPVASTTTHFRYLLLHWLHHETTLVALFPSFTC